MPENDDERADFDEVDAFDDDEDEPDRADRAWLGSGYPQAGYPTTPGGPGRPGRRGMLLAVTAVVAAAAGFGIVTVAIRDVSGGPAASATPSASAPNTGGSGGQPSGGTHVRPQAGGVPSLPPGATESLEIGGLVRAVSATSITVGGSGQEVTAAVTRATVITGKVTSISGIKVGDFVSASISGANGKLTADSIQDPVSLPSGPGQ
jgi:hypothetical protein